VLCKRHHASIIESLRLRYQNVALLDDLSVAMTEQAKANAELRSEIAERQRTQEALQTCGNLYKTLVETTGIGYHLLDANGVIVDANAEYVGLTGRTTLAEIKGKPAVRWVAPYDEGRAASEIKKCLTEGYIRNAEIDYIDDRGKITPVEINATLLDDSGSPQLLSLARDITERREADLALRRAYDQSECLVQERTAELERTNETLSREKEIFRVTLASIVDAVITTDAEARVTFVNAAATQLTGWNEAEAIGQPLAKVFQVQNERTHERTRDPVHRCLQACKSIGPENQYLICRNHERLAIDCSAAPIRDSHGTIVGAVLSFRDVTKQRQLAEQLSHQATHDKLTGLVNRHEFERRLQQTMASAATQNPHALLYLDLDQFKVVNDTCGHSAGDELLRQISALFHAKLRSRDTLARLGGDEFGIILQHCPVNEAHRVAQALRGVVQNFRFACQDRSFSLSVSIGLVPIVSSGETLESAMSAADSACYTAKDRGRDRVHVYQLDDSEVARRDSEMRWMPRIQQALQEDRFCLYFQPIRAVGARTKRGRHGEILVRMIDEQGGLVPPGAFLPAAERYGQMLAIDRWVVSRSFTALAEQSGGAEEMFYAINLSAQSIGAPEFREFVTDELSRTQVSADKICFEITETAAISELTQVLQFIDNLKARGCRFALDDFGTGLASFSYLKTLPVDYLKIDGTFVKDLATDEIDEAMVEAIHRIGHVMGLSTIAEWVENNDTLDKLRAIGVDYAQGFALGSPRPLLGVAPSHKKAASMTGEVH
jgi:diguanylate cyclase (GGDEF)-like protein/PAS domain S-box-containing protein